MRSARVLLIAVFVLAIGFSGCGKSNIAVENPFTFDYTVDETIALQVVEGDILETLIAASPFYTGAQPLPGVNSGQYDEIRRMKVEEIIADADQIVQTSIRIKPDLQELRQAYLEYLEICTEEDANLKDVASQTLPELVSLQSQQEITQAIYESLETDSESPLVSTFMEYTKVAKAVELGSLYLQDFNNLLVWSALVLQAMDGSDSSTIKSANANLDKQMSQFDSLRKELKSIAEGIGYVDNGLRQLETADFYMASAAVSFIEEELPTYKEKLNEAKPAGPFTDEDIELMAEYLALIEETSQAMRAGLEKADKSQLLEVNLNPSPFPSAWADGKRSGKDMARAIASMRHPASAVPFRETGTRSFSEALSQGWQDLKNGLKGAQTGIGMGIDTLSASFRSALNIPYGIYYGNSVKDIADNMKQNFREIHTNFQQGTSGTSTYRTAKDYFVGVEQGAQSIAESGAANVFGEGYTSWAVGHIARATASIFTSMGKGISALADPTSTTGELAMGALDVSMSLYGGSKVMFQGSKAPRLASGLAEGAGIMGRKSGNFITRMTVESGNRKVNQLLLKPITGQEYAIFSSTQKALLTALKKTNDQLNRRLGELASQGLAAWQSGARDAVQSSLNDYVRKQFQANMSGFLDAVTTALGKSASAYIDNVVGELADDYLKEMVKQALDAQPNFDGVYKGNTSASGIPGTMVMEITGQTVSGRITGTYSGRPSEYVKAKAVPFSASFKGTITPSDNNSGIIRCSLTGSMRGEDGDSYAFEGQFNGSVVDGKASGSWNAANEWGKHSGNWNANK